MRHWFLWFGIFGCTSVGGIADQGGRDGQGDEQIDDAGRTETTIDEKDTGNGGTGDKDAGANAGGPGVVDDAPRGSGCPAVTIAPAPIPPAAMPLPPPSSPQGTLSIPAARPRIWFTPETLPQARAWVTATKYTPDDKDPLGKAFSYLTTGNPAHGDQAIAYLMGVTLDADNSVSDAARWVGENAIVIYDWVHDRLREDQKQTLIPRWNTYIEKLNGKSWGGVGMEANNYYWGYTRNTLLWAIATHGENPRADAFLDYFLDTRWRDSFLPYARTKGRGGVPVEATDYGPYMLRYPVLGLASVACHGRNLWDETGFFKEAVMYLVHATTPAPTFIRDQRGGQQTFPFGDAHTWYSGASARSSYYGSFMTAVAMVWPQTAIGRYARQWLAQVKPTVEPFIAALDTGGAATAFDNLPFDYHASGPKFVWARNAWGADATILMAQLGAAENTDHQHMDAGNFQLWRKGRWLVRESVGYAISGQNITGYGGVSHVDINAPVAHNTVMVDGKGPMISNRLGAGEIVRLESKDDHLFVASDLTPVFRANATTQQYKPERDNPHVGRVVREIIFLRALDAVVVFDRIKSRSAGQLNARDVKKSFFIHFETKPTPTTGPSTSATIGDQVVTVTTLHPPNAVRRVVDEGGSPRGQHRLEVETGGAEQSYFLHVIEGRDAGTQALEMTLSETSTRFIVTIEAGTRGAVTLALDKGESSVGGAIACHRGPASCEGLTPFRTDVQSSHVDDTGVVWQR